MVRQLSASVPCVDLRAARRNQRQLNLPVKDGKFPHHRERMTAAANRLSDKVLLIDDLTYQGLGSIVHQTLIGPSHAENQSLPF